MAQNARQKQTAGEPGSELRELEEALGHRFRKPALLREALLHSSLRHEQLTGASTQAWEADPGDNERLEFLGDAIVGMLTAESLYRRFPDLREGELTRLRAALVSRAHLGEVGKGLRLGQWLRMGHGEERNGGRGKAVLLANCVEAVAAALYLDTGELETARLFAERFIIAPSADRLYAQVQANEAIGDYKSALQEFLQARGQVQPEYTVEGESGPDHRKHFLVEVRAGGEEALARGSGSTKKRAEQEAARRAFQKLNGKPSNAGEAP